MKKIAITGGAGFIGAQLVKRFAAKGYHILVLDNFIRGVPARLDNLDGHIDIDAVDICDRNQMIQAVKGCHAVFHLAAINGTANFYEVPDKILETGIKGIFNVMDACYENGIKELVVASSAEAYQHPEIIPTPEDVILKVPDPSNPRYSYGASKLISEVIALNCYREHFEKLQIFRPHNIYGPDMGTKHVIPQFILRLLQAMETENGEEELSFEIQGDGSETRAFCYIDDLINAFEVMYFKGGHRQIYHLGNPEEIAILDLVQEVFAQVSRPYRIKNTPLSNGSVKRRCPDISKIAKLGYSPTVTLKEGIARTFSWYARYYSTIPINALI